MNASEQLIQSVWDKGAIIPGKNPDVYRMDAAGNTIYRSSYGKNSEMGWQIDHKHPVAKGGSDNLRNLQPLQSAENRKKSDTYPYKY